MSKKSRKLIRSGGAQSASPAPVPEAEAIPTAPERNFFFLPNSPTEAVDERELHELMKDWRHGRATRTIGEALQDAYVAIFSVLMVGAMVVNLVIRAQTTVSQCTTASCLSARTLVPWATTAAAFAAALALSRLFGPVLASAAEGFWLMDAPISRRRLLRGRLLLAVLAALALGLVIGGLPAALSGSGPLAIGVWAAAGGLGCSGLVAFAAAQQGAERDRLVRVLQAGFAAASLAALFAVVAVAAGYFTLPVGADAGVIIAGVIAALGLAMLVAAWVVAMRRLDSIRRARLVSGGSLVSGMQGAMYALDFGLARDILVERDAIRRGHVRPTKGRGKGLNALIWRDLERIIRFPKPLVGLTLSVLAPYAVQALGLTHLTPLLSGLILMVVLIPFLNTLRVLSRTTGLARMFPFRTTQLRTAAMVVTALLAVVWHVLTIPAFVSVANGRSLVEVELVALVTALAGWLGAVRWVTAKKVDFNAPMVATETGAVPPTLIFNLFRGIDMVTLITAPVMLGAPVWLSLGIATAVFVGLRGTFNTAEIAAQKEALDRETAAAKAARADQAKIKVPRPGR